jgi:hypothetical protein
VIRVTNDILGGDYERVIANACERYDSFSLVWRDQFEFTKSALSIQSELEPFQIAREHTIKWPGTEIYGSRAWVIWYRVSAAKTGVLLRAKSLFGWRAGELPEDLAFYRADGTCSILTITHENEAIFYDNDWQKLIPSSAQPELEPDP